MKLNIWSKVQLKNPVWHFDATGSIIKNVFSQKPPYLFSIVIHDESNKILLPVAEFVTTSHFSYNISKFLYTINHKIKNEFKNVSYSVAPVIITDFSWVLINSVLETFNNCNIMQYLNIAYEALYECKQSFLSLKTKIYLCSTHFLKLIIKKSKKVSCSKEIRSSFIFLFTLLQNCIDIAMFETFLRDIFFLFNSKTQSKLLSSSMINLRKELMKRNTSEWKNIIDEAFFALDKIEINFDNIIFSEETNQKTKKDSPFIVYFEKKIHFFSNQIIDAEDLGNTKTNEYYCPRIFEIIKNYLHILPLWTGIFIQKCNESFPIHILKTRLTNNPVECWFKILKHVILCSRKKNMPSELCALEYQKIMATYTLLYKQDKPEKSHSDEKNENDELEEVWKPEKQKTSRTKGKFFKNVQLFRDIDISKLFTDVLCDEITDQSEFMSAKERKRNSFFIFVN
jgi:hypothetical protein